MKGSRFLSAVAVSVLALVYAATGQSAKVSESRQVFWTYPFGDPNPIARMGVIYPYWRFEGYSTARTKQAWTVVTMENQWIRVLVAPEIGGKVLGAFVLPSGEPFLYFNPVMKFREIAMRGPWASGGIEFNFGDIGHAPTTATPVDYMTRSNADGSVSCFVGAMDLSSRTVWRVEIRLPKDKAYFETHSFWYNPTSLATSLYHWMNAAAPAAPDLQFVYPGNASIDHGGNVFEYPIGPGGRDISRYANNAFGSHKSYHVLGSRTDFFGAYYLEKDVGVMHWSRYEQKPGKKIWMWSQARDGEIWTQLLTDPELGAGQYVEIQSGLLFNQAGSSSTSTPFKHQFLEPHSQERFSEAWFPVAKTGGVVEANLAGSLNVVRSGSKVMLAICPVRPIDEELVVGSGTDELFRERLRLRPLETYRREISAPESEPVTVTLGRDVFSYREGTPSGLQRPTASPESYDWDSVSGLAMRGAEQARQRNYSQALADLERCLERDPFHLEALALAAECRVRRGELDQALAFSKRALAVDAYDGAANFVYGLVCRKLGLLADARDGFGKAARTARYRSAAACELSEIALREDNWADAEHFAGQALASNQYDMRARRVEAIAARITRNRQKAIAAIDGIEKIDPLDHFARFERYLHSPSKSTQNAFASGVRSEMPHETFLELAVDYAALGLEEEAALVLESAPDHPIVNYWKAFLASTLGEEEKSKEELASALGASPALVFPHRAETADVLAWAEARLPHWKTKYYLALLAWSRGLAQEAAGLLAACGDQPNFASFYIARAELAQRQSPAGAERDYRKAVTAGPDEWRTYRALGSFYNARSEYGKALPVFEQAARTFRSSYIVLFDYAQTLLYNHHYEDCLAILDTLVVLPFEGAGYSRQTYREACLLAALSTLRAGDSRRALELVGKARLWPEHLGVGRPLDVDERIEDYLEARCRLLSGLDASELLLKVAKRGAAGPSVLLAASSLKRLGNEEEGSRLIREWSAEDPTGVLAGWCAAEYRGDRASAAKFLQEARKSSGNAWYVFPSEPDFLLVQAIATTIGLE